MGKYHGSHVPLGHVSGTSLCAWHWAGSSTFGSILLDLNKMSLSLGKISTSVKYTYPRSKIFRKLTGSVGVPSIALVMWISRNAGI